VNVDLPLLGMTEALAKVLLEEHWATFARRGVLKLGPIILPGKRTGSVGAATLSSASRSPHWWRTSGPDRSCS
jgi:hypothetical protein